MCSTPLSERGLEAYEATWLPWASHSIDPWAASRFPVTTAVQGHKPRPSGRCWLSRASIQEQAPQGCSPQPALKPDAILGIASPLPHLFPSAPEGVLLARAFGCTRVVWNDALALCRGLYKRGEKVWGAANFRSVASARPSGRLRGHGWRRLPTSLSSSPSGIWTKAFGPGGVV